MEGWVRHAADIENRRQLLQISKQRTAGLGHFATHCPSRAKRPSPSQPTVGDTERALTEVSSCHRSGLPGRRSTPSALQAQLDWDQPKATGPSESRITNSDSLSSRKDNSLADALSCLPQYRGQVDCPVDSLFTLEQRGEVSGLAVTTRAQSRAKDSIASSKLPEVFRVTADHIIFHDAATSNDVNDECLCSVELPDTAFPAHMVVFLQDAYGNLTFDIENEEEKITTIHFRIVEFQEKLGNLSDLITKVERKGFKEDADYQKVQDAIDELDKIGKDLSTILNITDVGVEDLLNQVNNVSSMVWQLETFDSNNVLATLREIDTLRKQLADCEEAAGNPNFGLPPAGLTRPEIGSCDNKVLLNISKPFIVKLNWRGFSYKYGGWGKDFALGTKNPGTYWVAPLNTDERLMETYRIYSTYHDLLLYKNQVERSLSQSIGLTWNYINCGQGSGMILYNNSFYYNCYNSRNLCKQDLANNHIKRSKVDNAVFNNWYSYSGVNWQDFDFAGDEKGLWVTYSTEKSQGNLIIAKLNPKTLKITKTWQTSLKKPEVTNTFMICGALYALKRVSAHKELIFYMYDTNTDKESMLEITMEKLADVAQSVSYNPNDQKIYMYNSGYLVTYDLMFNYQLPKTTRRERALLVASGGS
uniref:olfactomedin-like n=1 Tax=Euleptes europaea TaxID=460621 RepID=UPI00254099EE|nr:olfactomedin-like [Euleptes europaea]